MLLLFHYLANISAYKETKCLSCLSLSLITLIYLFLLSLSVLLLNHYPIIAIALTEKRGDSGNDSWKGVHKDYLRSSFFQQWERIEEKSGVLYGHSLMKSKRGARINRTRRGLGV